MSLYIPSRGSVVVGGPYVVSQENVGGGSSEKGSTNTPSKEEIISAAAQIAANMLFEKYGYRPERLVNKLAQELYSPSYTPEKLASVIVEKVEELIKNYAIKKFENKMMTLLSSDKTSIPLAAFLQGIARGLSKTDAASKANKILRGAFYLKPDYVSYINVTPNGIRIGNIELEDNEIQAALSYMLSKYGMAFHTRPKGTKTDVVYDGKSLTVVIKVLGESEQRPVVVIPFCVSKTNEEIWFDALWWIAGGLGWGLVIASTYSKRCGYGKHLVCHTCDPSSVCFVARPQDVFLLMDKVEGFHKCDTPWGRTCRLSMARSACSNEIKKCFERLGYWASMIKVSPCERPETRDYKEIILKNIDASKILKELDSETYLKSTSVART